MHIKYSLPKIDQKNISMGAFCNLQAWKKISKDGENWKWSEADFVDETSIDILIAILYDKSFS